MEEPCTNSSSVYLTEEKEDVEFLFELQFYSVSSFNDRQFRCHCVSAFKFTSKLLKWRSEACQYLCAKCTKHVKYYF